MRVILKDGLAVLVPESEDEARDLAAWGAAHDDHVFRTERAAAHVTLHDLGPRTEACREPINVVSNSPDPALAIIGNFATAPFVLDGERYRSVESFWQALKFVSDSDRRRLATLDGPDARAAGEGQGYGATVHYGGHDIAVGTWAHWQLMERACTAKFEQNDDARAALLATGDRPLIHVVRHDSRSIPGVIMASIWMRLRDRVRVAGAAPSR